MTGDVKDDKTLNGAYRYTRMTAQQRTEWARSLALMRWASSTSQGRKLQDSDRDDLGGAQQ